VSPSRIGAVHLTISDLARSVAFYQTQLGLRLHGRDGDAARLGTGGSDLLVLHESESAPRSEGTTGLYHFAVLVPSRADFAAALRRLIDTDTTIQGAADHGVSEALYLADPDGNGIEIYRDRPRREWPLDDDQATGVHDPGTTPLRMGSEPLDFSALLAEAGDAAGSAGEDDAGLLPAGTIIGHVHLHVARLDAAERFYAGLLGFDVRQRWGRAALFIAYDGYHHHVGLNTWKGVGAPPPPPGAIGLRYFELHVDDVSAIVANLDRAGVAHTAHAAGILVRDPSENGILLKSRERVASG
jgi:catechol 2,3-dioxygenase